MKTTGLRGLLASALAAAIALAGLSAPAAAAGSHARPAASAAAANKIVVKQNNAGVISVTPNTALAAKLVDFEFSSAFSYTDADGNVFGGDPEIFQLRNGGTLPLLDVKLGEAGQGGPTAIAAMQWILDKTTFFGGLPLVSSNKFGAILPAGTYYIAQMQLVPDLNLKPSTTAKKFTITGPSQAIQPYADQKITVVNTNGPDIFSAYNITTPNGELRNGPLTIINKTGSITSPRELHFFALWQVLPGTTVQQACDYFNRTGPSPFAPNGARTGFGTMSTQRAVHAYLNTPPGTYLIWSGVPDGNTGTPHIKECEGLIKQVIA